MGRNIEPGTGTGVVRIRAGTPVPEQRAQGAVVFVRYFVELPLRFDVAEQTLLRSPTQWAPGLAERAVADGAALLAEVGAGQDRVAREQLAVAVGPVVRSSLKTILAMTWRPAGARVPSPALEADIELGALGRERTQLSISARYRPPQGTVGPALDRAVLHRVAETTVKSFLDGTGRAIECLAGSGSREQS